MKGIITIAGYGTRFLPASRAIPKEMFPIAGVPLLQYHVESLVAAGIEDIIVVIRGGGGVIEGHFAPAPDLEQHLEAAGKLELLQEMRRITQMANIVTVRQPATLPYGNASPALAALPWLTPGEPFYYMFGDDIMIADTPVPRQLLDAYHTHAPAAVLATQWVPDEEKRLYGCIEFKPGSDLEMARIIEKAAIGIASMCPSTPPHSTMSASPMTMCRQAWAMASAPDEQAETGVMTPARAPMFSPATADGPLGMAIETASGETLR